MISDFLEAIRFLTILPVPPTKEKAPLARAMFFFPLMGFLIGLFCLLVVRQFQPYFTWRLASLLLVTLSVLFSGGLHLDGWADFCDGFFGGKNRAETLRIMRDSRIGVWGALGVTLLLFWKWELLASLQDPTGPFLLALTMSRWTPVVLAYFLPYANPAGGLGEQVARKVKIRELAGATAFAAGGALFWGAPGILTFLALLPFLGGMGFLFWKRVGGITGDLLGAMSEMTELFVLFLGFLGGVEIR